LLAGGPLALLIALSTIGLCWYLNPWFDFWRDAFSDLGTRRACCPWLYNLGLLLSGLSFLAFSSGVYALSTRRMESMASGLLGTASIFLMMIGIFPGGTEPHNFVSTWFFIQSFLGFSFLGIEIIREERPLGVFVSLPSMLSIPLALLVEVTIGWPSAAVAEAAGISALAVSMTCAVLHYAASSGRPRNLGKQPFMLGRPAFRDRRCRSR